MENKKYPDGIQKLIFNYFPGWDLFHKVSVLSRSLREDLPRSGLLEQWKVITVKDNLPNLFMAPGSF